MRFLLPLAAACLLFTPCAFGQGKEPPADLLKGVFAKGTAPSGEAAGATRFQPSGSRLLLDQFVDSITEAEEERKLLRQAFGQMMTEYEKAAKAAGMENDVALAASFAASSYWSLWKGKDIPEGGERALLNQMQKALSTPEMAKRSDAEKQRLYEALLYGVFSLQFTAVLAEEGKDTDARKTVTTAARGELVKLLGLSAEKILLTANGIEGAGTPPATAKAGNASLDAVLAAYTFPQGWETKTYSDGSVVAQGVVVDDERNHNCEIRLLAPRPAPGGAAKAFQALWQEAFADFQAGSVSIAFRRVFPGGAATHYMGGFYKTKNGGELYVAVYVMDLGDKVLPIVLSVVPGRRPTLEYDYRTSAYMTLANATLPFLTSLKFKKPPPVRAALFTKADIVGKWQESSSSMVVGGYYVTAGGNYAGEMMSSFGMRFTLRPDNTFDYLFAYANRGAREVGQDKNEGRYTLSGDILNCDPKFARTYKYRYKVFGAGFIQTDKGNLRALILRGADSSGNFEQPPLYPNGKSWQGPVSWLTEVK